MSLFDRFRRHRSRRAPVIDPPARRAPMPPAPPPPAPPSIGPSVAPAPAKPSMRLMMEDGTTQELPPDPELEARADYLIRSMLPPAPPPPPSA